MTEWLATFLQNNNIDKDVYSKWDAKEQPWMIQEVQTKEMLGKYQVL